MAQLDLFKKSKPVIKKPPFRVTQEFVDDLRGLLKSHKVDFVAYTDDGVMNWRWMSSEMVDGKYPVFVVDFEQLADAVNVVK
jgi:hypothetical protein